MKRLKCAVALVLTLLFCVMGYPVSAEDPAVLTVASVSAKVGDTVTISVEITPVENVASLEVHLGYDTTALRCVGAQMSDTVKSLSMSNVNTKPVAHPDEVWLTAVGANPVTLDGTVMTVSFEVLSTAKKGVSPLEVRKVTLLNKKIEDIAVTFANGGVNVENGIADTPTQNTSGVTTTPTTTATVATTTSTNTSATGTTAQNGSEPTGNTTTEGETVTTTVSQDSGETRPTAISPDGETVALPEQTVVDIGGSVVTDASGVPSRVNAVAVMIGSATGTPGDTVTVKVALSAVKELSALGIAVHYDTKALQFEDGECVGFLKDGAKMTSVVEHKSGVVDISATADALSGNGEIAELRFKIKANAKNGEYRIVAKGNPLVQSGMIELPVKSVAGKIVVEGGRSGYIATWFVAGGAVLAAVTVATVVAVILSRKKKVAPKAAVVDVSGDSDN